MITRIMLSSSVQVYFKLKDNLINLSTIDAPPMIDGKDGCLEDISVVVICCNSE